MSSSGKYIGIASCSVFAEVGIGAKPMEGTDIIFDGTRKMMDNNWTSAGKDGLLLNLAIYCYMT